jgi:tRNA-specific 2-thiouridylase
VVVGPREALRIRKIALSEVNWLAAVAGEVDCTVKVRSTHVPAAAHVIVRDDARAEVEIADARSAVAPGQACVFYGGSRVLGGGWIAKTEPLSRAA